MASDSWIANLPLLLRTGGGIGLSDRGSVLPKGLDGLLKWIARIAAAQRLDSYVQYLRAAAFAWNTPNRTMKLSWKW